MTAAINLELPWPPTVNEYWKPVAMKGRDRSGREVKGAKLYMTARAKLWRRDAIIMVRQQLGPPRPFSGDVAIKMEVIPVKNNCDIDNFCKPVFDALQYAEVYHNDRQIKRLAICMRDAQKPGYIRLAISSMD